MCSSCPNNFNSIYSRTESAQFQSLVEESGQILISPTKQKNFQGFTTKLINKKGYLGDEVSMNDSNINYHKFK